MYNIIHQLTTTLTVQKQMLARDSIKQTHSFHNTEEYIGIDYYYRKQCVVKHSEQAI